jgi:hypothetical protein
MNRVANNNAFFFIGRFGLSYLLFSLLYSLFLAQYEPKPYPFTHLIGEQLISILNLISSDQAYLHIEDNQLLVNLRNRDVV